MTIDHQYVPKRPLVVVVIACTQQTKHYKGTSLNDINYENTEYSTFSSREISYNDWLQ